MAPFAITLVVATLWTFLPGLLIGWFAGLRRLLLVALAPAIGLALYGVGGVLLRILHVPFNPVTVVLVTALAAVGCGRITAVLRHRLGVYFRPPRRARRPVEQWCWLIGALFVAGALQLGAMHQIIPKQDNIANGVDGLFHYNAVQWIVQTHDASSLTVYDMVTNGHPHQFYPVAWHALDALVTMSLGNVSVIPSVNATLYVGAILVWPLSLLAFIDVALPFSRGPLFFLPAFTACFPTFPTMLLGWAGPIFPNVFALFLVPAVLAALVAWFGLGRGTAERKGPLLLGVLISLVGLAIAHPGALMTLLVIVLPLLVTWTAGLVAQRRSYTARALRIRLGLAVLILLGIVVAFLALRPPAEAAPRFAYAEGNYAQAIGLVVTLMGVQPFGLGYGVAIAVIAGIYATFRLRHLRWLSVAHLLFGYIFVFTYTHKRTEFRYFLSGAWYSDSSRVAPMLVLTGAPLALVGAYGLGLVVARRVRLMSRGRLSWLRLPVAAVLAWTLAAGWFTADAWNTDEMRAQRAKAVKLFSAQGGSLVDSDELALLAQIADVVPAGERIATSPLNGGSLAYAVSSRPTTTTHAFYPGTADGGLISDHLRDAASDPAVCAAVRRQNVHWALDFGRDQIFPPDPGTTPYAGLLDLDGRPGFTPVLRFGPKTLYRVDVCWS